MVRLRPDKNLYLNKGFRRRKQIYRWFNNVVNGNNLSFFYKDIFMLLSEGKTEEAVLKFKELILTIINTKPEFEDGGTFSYLLEENIQVFGINRVTKDLFSGVIVPQVKEKIRIPKKVKPVRRVELEKIVREAKAEEKRRFTGFTKQDKREGAELRVRTNGTFYLKSKKTGQFLRMPKSLKVEIRKRQEE